MRRLTVLLLAAVSALASAVLCAAPAGAAGFQASYQRIHVADGIDLTAGVYTPNSPGRHPLVVMPASWAMPTLEYVAPAVKLANAGYQVISYTARGFWTSGGQIGVASPADIADVSTIIDWAGRNTGADTGQVGMVGVSYGAGIGLLAAAHDRRIRAVSSLSTWADIIKSLLPNNTWSRESASLLEVLARLTGRFGPDLDSLITKFHSDDRTGLDPLNAPRSPDLHLDELNANKPAVLIGNGWQDSIFPPDQVTDFFDKLDTPKRLDLAPGDHAVAELTGLGGLPNDYFDTTYRWLDHYLRGADNGVDREKPVQLRPTLGGDVHGYDSWPALTTRTDRRYLGGLTPVLNRTGELATTARTGWQHQIFGGVDTVADAGPAILSGAATAVGIPVLGWLPAVNRLNAGVWQTEAAAKPVTVAGTPRLHTTVTTNGKDTTLVGYLYDVDGLGTGKLLSWKPITTLGATPNAPHPVEVSFQPVLHQLAAGHRLVLAVDTADQRFGSETTIGENLTFSSPRSDPSYLDVPLG